MGLIRNFFREVLANHGLEVSILRKFKREFLALRRQYDREIEAIVDDVFDKSKGYPQTPAELDAKLGEFKRRITLARTQQDQKKNELIEKTKRKLNEAQIGP